MVMFEVLYGYAGIIIICVDAVKGLAEKAAGNIKHAAERKALVIDTHSDPLLFEPLFDRRLDCLSISSVSRNVVRLCIEKCPCMFCLIE